MLQGHIEHVKKLYDWNCVLNSTDVILNTCVALHSLYYLINIICFTFKTC